MAAIRACFGHDLLLTATIYAPPHYSIFYFCFKNSIKTGMVHYTITNPLHIITLWHC